ncbi:MAG: hypothetical protein M3065_06785 [Actinomycetota bacterium]|nr:hypothetical protein [Actinomycetota bacterium]
MSHDTARYVLSHGVTPGERARLGEGFYYRVYRESLAAIAVLSLGATGLSLLNPHRAWLGTTLVCAAVGGGVVTVRSRYSERGYIFLRNHRHVPAMGAVLLAALPFWPAVDPNAIYFPAIAILGLIVSIAQRRREIAGTAIALAAGSVVSSITSSTSPAAHTPAGFVLPTLGVLVVGVLLALLVEYFARMAMIEPAVAEPDADPGAAGVAGRRPASRITDQAGDAALPRGVAEPSSKRTADTRLSELLCSARDRAHLHADGYTGREVQIFLLIHEGFTQTEAAGYLRIRPNTVHKMTAAVRRRRKLSSTNDVIEDLRELGYLVPLRLLAEGADVTAD